MKRLRDVMIEDSDNNNTLARAIAPEDICEGDFLAVLAEVDEFLPIGVLFDCSAFHQPKWLEPVRVRFLPCGESVPLKVEAVCLPFVLVKAPLPAAFRMFGYVSPAAPSTVLRTLDVRRYRLARLTPEYGKRVYKLLKDRGEKKRSSAVDEDV
ncbi:MAG TPA: hypothetical protein VMS30_02995 [Phycisphaerales bacterium]|nr:hypothetical protein [Phycisphaerales bacterium]